LSPGKGDRKLPVVPDEPEIVWISPLLKNLRKIIGPGVGGQKIFPEGGLRRRLICGKGELQVVIASS